MENLLYTDAELNEIFKEYGKLIGFKNLREKPKYKGYNIRLKYVKIKTEYNQSNESDKKKLREFWTCFPRTYWTSREKKVILSDDEWKKIFIKYNEEIGFENLKQKTKYNNYTIGNKYKSIKNEYKESQPLEREKLKEFWNCLPESTWLSLFRNRKNRKNSKIIDNVIAMIKNLSSSELNIIREYINNTNLNDKTEPLNDIEWLEIFNKYEHEVGISNLKSNTKFNGYNLGEKFENIKKDFNDSDKQRRIQIIKFWTCFNEIFFYDKELPVKFKDIEWLKIFIEYDKEIGFKKLGINTIFKNFGIGVKFLYIKRTFKALDTFEKELVKGFWKCFPEYFWIDYNLKDIFYKEIFIAYDKEIGIENIVLSTKYMNYNIGDKLKRLIRSYRVYSPAKQKALREFWDIIPLKFFEAKSTEEIHNHKWLALFKKYDKEIGLINLKKYTYYKNHNLGSKYIDIIKKYNISNIKTQKEMKEFWDCFPLSIWDNL